MTMHPGPMLASRPPLAAYREDLARRGDQDGFGPSDATWLSVATILRHGVDVPADSRPPLLPTLREVVGSDPTLREVLAVAEHEPSPDFELDAVSPIVRAVVEHMEDSGALSLAYSTLALLADADLRLSILERGRVLAQLGRVAWKAGALETAREQYRRAEVLGRTARIPELRVRAWVGYSIVARLRGNYPEVRHWATRAAYEADRVGLAALGSLAYHSLMISAGVAGDFNAALVYGWQAFSRAASDAAREAEMLLNLSQLLLACGHPAAASNGFTVVLSQVRALRLTLPALGGLARAAAAQGDREQLQAARIRIEQVISGAELPYHAADALLELSEALAEVGDARGAGDARARALEIAERHSYHEITHRLEALRIGVPIHPAEAPHALDFHGTKVACAVASLALAAGGANVNGG